MSVLLKQHTAIPRNVVLHSACYLAPQCHAKDKLIKFQLCCHTYGSLHTGSTLAQLPAHHVQCSTVRFSMPAA